MMIPLRLVQSTLPLFALVNQSHYSTEFALGDFLTRFFIPLTNPFASTRFRRIAAAFRFSTRPRVKVPRVSGWTIVSLYSEGEEPPRVQDLGS
eukprot:241649-Rhodomonas_salina.2